MRAINFEKKPTVAQQLILDKQHMEDINKRIQEGRHDPLPVSVAAKPPHLVFISQCTPLIAAAAKKVALSAIRNQPINLDETIQAILLQIWNNGYNSGLKDMDQMHRAVSVTIHP